MILTEKQAKTICDILGFNYSHHEHNVKNEYHKNYQIYFYEGMSPWTFSLDTITAECKTFISFSFVDPEMRELMIKSMSNEIDLERKNVLEEFLLFYKDWPNKNNEVIIYLKQENLL